MSMRTAYCGETAKSPAGSEVTLCGWVNRRRDLGGLIFIDLRDRTGIVQVVFDPDSGDVHQQASVLRNEYCIQVKGIVRQRPENQVNDEMKTGRVEIYAKALNQVLEDAQSFYTTTDLEVTLRYLDGAWRMETSPALFTALLGGV